MSDDDVIRVGMPLRDAAAKPRPEDETIRTGTPLRDAAVDPRPGDNPPGALTREAQAKARGEQLPEVEVPPWR